MRWSHKLLLVPLVSLCLLACQQEQASDQSQKPDTVIAPHAEPRNTIQPVDTMAEVPADDTRRELDSMMSMEVTLPPLLDETAYDTATVNGFTRLADLTKGEMKLLASAKLLEQNITDIICRNSTDYADILFMVDNSGSMEDDIAAVKEGMNQIIDVLKERKGVRLAIATYRDKQYNTDDWFSFRVFETDYAAAKKFTDSMSLKPNEDLPESVYEAFIEVAGQQFWRSRTKRVVLIIGDARPKEKGEGGEFVMADMLKKAGESRIKVNFFPLIVTPYSERYRAHDLNPKPATETKLIERVYPNPTQGDIFLKMATPGRYHLTIYTMTGLLVEERYIDDELGLIDMGFHGSGLYVLRVTDENNQYDVAKFVVRK